MKPDKKGTKSPYNQPPVKLRAQIIQQKIPKNKQVSSSQSDSDSEQSSYDSEVQDFANQFYDQAVQKADQSLKQKKDKQMMPQQPKIQQNQNQSTKIKKVQSQYDKISARLKNLKANYDQIDLDLILFKKKDQNKLKQIASFLSKKHRQKRQFKRKLKKIKNSQKQKKKTRQQMQKKQQEQQHAKRLRQIRKISLQIKEKVLKKKEQQQQKLQKVEEFYENFEKKFKNRKLFQLMEMHGKERRNKQIQRQNQYLKQRKKTVSQLITSQQISQSKKRQQLTLRDLQKVRQAQKSQKNMQIAQKNRELKEKIYLSNQYLQIQEESVNRQKIKGIPKMKLGKIKKYDSYVRQNFFPLSNKNQQDELDNNQNKAEKQQEKVIQINGKIYRQVKRDKYLNGLKIGQILCNLPMAKTQRQMKMVGNGYLQQLKLLPKKRHSTSLDISRISEQKQKVMTARIQIPKIPMKPGRINLPKNASRYQVQNLIKSLRAKDQFISRKQHYFKVSNKNMESSLQKQELDDNMLDNIQKKLNLLGRL